MFINQKQQQQHHQQPQSSFSCITCHAEQKADGFKHNAQSRTETLLTLMNSAEQLEKCWRPNGHITCSWEIWEVVIRYVAYFCIFYEKTEVSETENEPSLCSIVKNNIHTVYFTNDAHFLLRKLQFVWWLSCGLFCMVYNKVFGIFSLSMHVNGLLVC